MAHLRRRVARPRSRATGPASEGRPGSSQAATGLPDSDSEADVDSEAAGEAVSSPSATAARRPQRASRRGFRGEVACVPSPSSACPQVPPGLSSLGERRVTTKNRFEALMMNEEGDEAEDQAQYD